MAIDYIIKEVFEKGGGTLEIRSNEEDALEDFIVSLRRMSPQIVIDRDGLRRSDDRLTAKITVVDDSYDWVRSLFESILQNDRIFVNLLQHEKP